MTKTDVVFIDWQDWPTIARGERKIKLLTMKGYKLIDVKHNARLKTDEFTYKLKVKKGVK